MNCYEPVCFIFILQEKCEYFEEMLNFKCETYDLIIKELITFLKREAQEAYLYTMKSDLFGDDILKETSENSSGLLTSSHYIYSSSILLTHLWILYFL